MNYKNLRKKRDFVLLNKNKLSQSVLENYNEDFNINFTHNSTAIEGNTLTLMETKLLLEDKLSVHAKHLNEIYEVINHNKAWNYVLECVKKNEQLDEDKVKEIHYILMKDIIIGGIYRTVDVKITGAKHTPLSPNKAYYELQKFYQSLEDNNYNDFEIAAYTHAEFVKIHPFEDGNGRTSRIIMNYQLIKNGYLPVSIKKENRYEYYDALDEYATAGNLTPFLELIYQLEEKELDYYINAIDNVIKEENING